MKKRPRILLLDHTAVLGGAELSILRLLRHIDTERFDCRALLFSDGPLAGQLRESGITVDILPLSDKVVTTSRHEAGRALFRMDALLATIRHMWRVARFIRANQIDLVHTHSLKANFIGGFASRLAGRPCIWHLHIGITDEYMPPRVARVFRTLTRIIPRYLIANSESTLQSIRTYNAKRATVIYPGIQYHEFAGSPPSAPNPSLGATVGLIGRISPTKGQDIFLQASVKVLQQFPNTRFQIIGSALFNDLGYEKTVRDLAESLGVSAAVEFTGFVSDVASRLRALDIFVLASTMPEPFGQILVEAMAAGKPVIATDAGGVPEIVTHGQNGWLIPPSDPARMADAICHLLSHPEETARMAVRGQQRVAERFTIERTARDVEAVYEALLS
jgi:glycosyltransferase involved in cell wall biosynthesis